MHGLVPTGLPLYASLRCMEVLFRKGVMRFAPVAASRPVIERIKIVVIREMINMLGLIELTKIIEIIEFMEIIAMSNTIEMFMLTDMSEMTDTDG